MSTRSKKLMEMLDVKAKELDIKHQTTFVHNDTRNFIEWSDCNEGWMVYLYPVAKELEDRFGQESFLCLQEKYEDRSDSIDGGLCTGSALDAVEFFL